MQLDGDDYPTMHQAIEWPMDSIGLVLNVRTDLETFTLCPPDIDLDPQKLIDSPKSIT